MTAESPSFLPEIDAVEIVDLREINPVHVSDHMREAKSAPKWRVTGTTAQLIASLWRSLPPAGQKRCHIPPFGFRFFCLRRLVAEASVCWQCNNVFGTMEGRDFLYEFDASEPAARRLLAEAQRVTGILITE